MRLELDTEAGTVTVLSYSKEDFFTANEVAAKINELAFSLSQKGILLSKEVQEAIKHGACYEGEL